jgi:hypothetical protein
MSRNHLLLSDVLADVASAIASAQKDMDRLASQSIDGLPFAPLAFIVKRTDVTLLGSLSMPGGAARPARDSALSYALLDRVQTGLRGSQADFLSSRVSISIEAVKPPNGN